MCIARRGRGSDRKQRRVRNSTRSRADRRACQGGKHYIFISYVPPKSRAHYSRDSRDIPRDALLEISRYSREIPRTSGLGELIFVLFSFFLNSSGLYFRDNIGRAVPRLCVCRGIHRSGCCRLCSVCGSLELTSATCGHLRIRWPKGFYLDSLSFFFFSSCAFPLSNSSPRAEMRGITGYSSPILARFVSYRFSAVSSVRR